jgi:branched-chain amino acid transport system substrate-binding protein
MAQLACLALLASLLAGMFAACTQPATPALLDSQTPFTTDVLAELTPPPAYRIGLQTEVTGEGAQIGDLTIRAARLAVEEVNAGGGVAGKVFELVVRDVRSDPATALAEYRAALTTDHLDALIGPFKSAYAVQIVPEHRQVELPMFIGATNATLTELNDRNLFRMRPSDRVTAAAIVAFALSGVNAQRIGVVYDTDAFGSGGARRIREELAATQRAPSVEIGYVTGAPELDTIARQLANTNIDTILIYGTNGADVGRLLRGLRYWKVNATVITSPGGATVPAHNIAAEAQDGIYVVTDALLRSDASGAAFVARFEARFGFTPDTYIAWVYDAIHLLADRWRQQPDAAQSTLSALIRAEAFHGVQGVYRFDANGDGLHSVVIVQMQDGVATPRAYFDGETRTLTLAHREQQP